ncbi:MAG: glycosyltransferase family 2 protein [Planctomycetes bacterium]|nr:glycosyltransferase family 2 protein [Planctomycetota bacterium]
MSTALPTISVLVPCYNAERYLADALDSVIAQTLAPLECIVVDDGSTDGSAAIADSYSHPFRVIRQSNQGRAAAMNTAIAEARGELVVFLDADDFWLPEMLEAQAQTIARTGAAMAYCPAQRCDRTGRDLPHRVATALPERCLPQLLHSNQLNGCGAAVRTDVIRSAGGFDGRFWPADDYHLWLRIAAEHRIAFQPRALGRYRMYPEQASAARVKMALVALAAKLDFLRNSPRARRQLGAATIRETVEDPFFDTVRLWFDGGHQSAARQLSRAYLRHWPLRWRGWQVAFRAHLPWRFYAQALPACPGRAI